MKIDIRVLPYFHEDAPPEIVDIFETIYHCLGQEYRHRFTRLPPLAVIHLKIATSNVQDREFDHSNSVFSQHRFVVAISGDHDNSNGEVETVIEQALAKFSKPIVYSGLAKNNRCRVTQNVPDSLFSCRSQQLTASEKTDLLHRVEFRLQSLKSLLRTHLSGYLGSWSSCYSTFKSLSNSGNSPVKLCEHFNFEIATCSDNDTNWSYWFTWLCMEPSAIEQIIQSLSVLIDNQKPLTNAFTTELEDFTWLEYLVAKRDYFANVLDWEELSKVTAALQIRDIREYCHEPRRFRDLFSDKTTAEKMTTCLDFLWRYRQFRHFCAHAAKRFEEMSLYEVCLTLATISRLGLWASRRWTRKSDTTLLQCCQVFGVTDVKSFMKRVKNEFNVDDADLSSPSTFSKTYQLAWPKPVFEATLFCLELLREGDFLKDFAKTVTKLQSYGVDLQSVLIPSTTEWSETLYKTVRLYNIKEAYQIEKSVLLFRCFYLKFEETIRDSINYYNFNNVLNAAAAFVCLWPPPPPVYEKRLLSFFPNTAADNAFEAVCEVAKEAAKIETENRNIIESVHVDMFEVQRLEGADTLVDCRLCEICRQQLISRLKEAIHTEVNQVIHNHFFA